uniref:NAD-dependent epimerase/dehydratase domain-containing protein n=1 Tax=Acrobeloides nanus TaxID=290746 RepID=A0A914D537_9BILA
MAASKYNIRVLVTGASGYVGSHCVQQLLAGGYSVRGTVRSLKNKEKVQPLRNLGYARERLELVEADLLESNSWPKAVDSCDYVLHVASPFQLVADENTIKTAVEGTLNVLKACSKYGHEDNDHVFTEKDWTNVNGKNVNTYMKSKTFAEKAAWEFVDSIPRGDNTFKLTCLNPGLIAGPSLTDDQGTSVTLIKRILNHEVPGLPKMYFNSVDVRDVAKAHVLAMENPQTDGERIILVYDFGDWAADFSSYLVKEFESQGYRIPTCNIPYFIVWLGSFFDESAKDALGLIGVEHKISNNKAKNLLDFQFTSTEKALVDMGYSLIEKGVVPKKQGYKSRTRL